MGLLIIAGCMLLCFLEKIFFFLGWHAARENKAPVARRMEGQRIKALARA